jgi:hypothetical protein
MMMNQKHSKEFELINQYSKNYAQSNQKQVLSKKIGNLEAIGLSMKDIRTLGKTIGNHHELAEELFDSNTYEFLMLASIIANPLKLDFDAMKNWLIKAQSTAVVDQGLSPLLMNCPNKTQWLKKFLLDSNQHIRYGGYSLLSSYFRGESLEILDYELGNKALQDIKKTIANEPITIQNAMNNAVIMAGLHVPILVDVANDVAAHIGHVMPLVARNQCNIQSASDYLKRYSNQPKYSRVAMLNSKKE